MVAHRFNPSSGTFHDCTWAQIEVGDVLKVLRDQQIPADLVVLLSNDSDGILFTDTCNLDGETNLKVKNALPTELTKEDDISTLDRDAARIKCDLPNNKLYTFNGCFIFRDRERSVDNSNVLLRGCNLRNTEWAIGIVAYTGLETKLMMNSSIGRTKRSNLERGLNRKLLLVMMIIIGWGFIASLIGLSFQQKQIVTGKSWYFFYSPEEYSSAFVRWVILFVSNVVVINAMIPISLYVTLEIVRVIQALQVSWDKEMVADELRANARTSNISDDLGQIEYIFSDKTGTLTQNSMEFMKCSIAGVKYGTGLTDVGREARLRRGESVPPRSPGAKSFSDPDFSAMLRSGPPPEVTHFLWLLSVSHAVIPEADLDKPHGINYQASSPDEAALVYAAADFGYVFTARTGDSVTVEINGREEHVDVMANLEFTSERKRSSVIVRRPGEADFVLYCKGADDVIFQRLGADSPHTDATKQHLREFADDGLRTLCCAYRVITTDEFDDWIHQYREATCLIQDRDARVDEVCNAIECNLTLLGATAIEDKLQADVSDTIQSLLLAGINVWVITGDKRETAINIGYACGLLLSGMKLHYLDDPDPDNLDRQLQDELDEKKEANALIVSGAALEVLFQPNYVDRFYALASGCQSIVACRVSPLQKASIVKLVRGRTGKITLAIGDGANDVGMIMEADVGVGISGKEGRQAVLASDYSFAEFRFLKRLLLTHGRCSFFRNVDLVSYSFYKNIAFSFNQILFQFFSQFSGNTLYNSLLYTIFNVVFTSTPPVVYAAFERDVALMSMMNAPELYHWDGKREDMLSFLTFLWWMLVGLVHAIVTFFVPFFGMRPFIDQNGRAIAGEQFGVTVYACVVTIVNLQIATMCHYWSLLHHVFIWGSIILYPICVVVLSYVRVSMWIFHTGFLAFGNTSFYFSVIACVMIGLWPTMLFKAYMSGLSTIRNKTLRWESKTRQTWKREEWGPEQKRNSLRAALGDCIKPPPMPVEIEFVDTRNPYNTVWDPPAPILSNFLSTQRQREGLGGTGSRASRDDSHYSKIVPSYFAHMRPSSFEAPPFDE
jgi:phospholipid-translocating P-type ATPase (flippase)